MVHSNKTRRALSPPPEVPVLVRSTVYCSREGSDQSRLQLKIPGRSLGDPREDRLEWGFSSSLSDNVSQEIMIHKDRHCLYVTLTLTENFETFSIFMKPHQYS